MISLKDTRIYWSLGLWLASLLSAGAQAPDLLTLLRQSGTGADVTFCYPGVISHARARQHLNELSRRAGWTVTDVRITDESPLKSGASPLTGVSFHVQRLPSGPLPALALAETFRDLKILRLIFLMDAGYPFRGPYPYEDRYVRIAGESSGSTHSYTVFIKDAAFDHLTAPGSLALPAAPTAAAPSPRRGSWLGLALAAIGLALLAYWAAERMLRRQPIRGGGKKTW